ncbi:hypothetical protein [Paenibacillus apis]|uniref:Uncharacterized protein n=1 Tax=Paenibacillus apis TaxID=1792174 RepID=A0A920CM59_9BACL|nr:hypothetical protein [Paenibacillus apis]GIO41757.1 hypothetical protein J41TS4_15150 [Paenibacillus apis]
MDNLEIILEDFRKDMLNKLVFEELKISSLEAKSSHFFDKNSGDDIEFYQVKNLKEILSPLGTGNVFLNQVEIGCSINNVLIIFSFDKDVGDITFNFSERELLGGEGTEIKLKAKKIVETLLVLKDKYDIPKIRIGFEPASDDDSCLLVICQEAIDLESAVERILR